MANFTEFFFMEHKTVQKPYTLRLEHGPLTKSYIRTAAGKITSLLHRISILPSPPNLFSTTNVLE